MGAKASQFKGDKQRRWMLENKWRSDILAYADLCTALAVAEPRSDDKRSLMRRFAESTRDLYTRAAELELQVEKEA